MHSNVCASLQLTSRPDTSQLVQLMEADTSDTCGYGAIAIISSLLQVVVRATAFTLLERFGWSKVVAAPQTCIFATAKVQFRDADKALDWSRSNNIRFRNDRCSAS